MNDKQIRFVVMQNEGSELGARWRGGKERRGALLQIGTTCGKHYAHTYESKDHFCDLALYNAATESVKQTALHPFTLKVDLQNIGDYKSKK